MTRIHLAAGLAAIALFACAHSTKTSETTSETTPASGTPRVADKSGDEESDMICTYEMPTGSHLAEEVCRTREEVERQHRTSTQMVDQLGQNGGKLPNGSR